MDIQIIENTSKKKHTVLFVSTLSLLRPAKNSTLYKSKSDLTTSNITYISLIVSNKRTAEESLNREKIVPKKQTSTHTAKLHKVKIILNTKYKTILFLLIV